MQAFRTHTGIGVPLRRSNVDTDQIIPAVYLKRVTRTGFEDGLFAAWRTDPSFVLNLPPFDKGSVLVAGPDFGTGSSREHAVWALDDYGFRVVIASSFADIFANNCVKNGVLTVPLTEDETAELARKAETPGYQLTVDLESCSVRDEQGFTAKFKIDEFTRHCLLEGLDDIGLTMQHEGDISKYESRHPAPAAWRS